MSEWIPVTDRLPNSDENVLVVVDWFGTWTTMLGFLSPYSGTWGVFDDGDHGAYRDKPVSHWMPLPKPPQEENRLNI